MSGRGEHWVIVLAAGDGRRLHSLTTDATGVAVPKQFCSLSGGQTLLEETLERARAVANEEHIVCIVAESHRQWWHLLKGILPERNLVVQPRNRGTANGIAMPVLQVLDQDPTARILIMPSDHFVLDEQVLVQSMRRALRAIAGDSDHLLLLGITPEEADPELGYIQPGPAVGPELFSVANFVEKPAAPLASSLCQSGALWNSFIMAAEGQTLLDLYANNYPEVVLAMIDAIRADRSGNRHGLRRVYDDLPDIDFSRHVLTGAEHRLRLLPVAACGWSDLGTPASVARTLQRLPSRRRQATGPTLPFISLAAAQLRLQATARGVHPADAVQNEAVTHRTAGSSGRRRPTPLRSTVPTLPS